MSTPALVACIVAGALAFAGVLVTFVVVLVKKLSPADFGARPSAAGLEIDAVAPDVVGPFRRAALEREGASDTARACYTSGAAGDIELRIARSSSAQDAALAIKRERRQRFRVTRVAKIGGDHSYFACGYDGRQVVGWTNAEWYFLADAASRDAVETFARAYPY